MDGIEKFNLKSKDTSITEESKDDLRGNRNLIQRTKSRQDSIAMKLDCTRLPHRRLIWNIEKRLKTDKPLSGHDEIQNSQKSFENIPHVAEVEMKIEQTRKDKEQMKSGVKKSEEKSAACIRKYSILKEFSAQKSRFHRKPPEISEHLALLQRLRESKHYDFVYMKYAVSPSSPYFDLYCYVEVPFQETDGITYATASPKGITQIFPNEAKFTPLDMWEQNYILFKKIRNLKTFLKFRLWKTFAIWKFGLNWRKYQARQAFINKSLFILEENLRNAILTLYKRFLHLSNDSFVDLTNTEKKPFFYFLEDQMVKYEFIRDELNTLRQHSLDVMDSAMKSSLLSHGFLVDDSNFDAPPQAGARKRVLGKYMSYRQRVDKRNYCNRLTCFLSYMDNHVIALLRTVLYQSFENLINIFKMHSRMMPPLEILEDAKMDAVIGVQRYDDSPMTPMFTLALDMTSTRVGLDPSEEIVFTQIDDLIALWENCVYNYERYVSDMLFDPFTNPIIMGKKIYLFCGNPADIKIMLEDEAQYRKIRLMFYDELTDNFEKVKIYIKRFDKLRIMYAEDSALNVEVIRKERDLNVHRRWLERFTRQLQFLNDIPNKQSLGLFLLKQSQLKKIMLPVTMNLMNELSYVLPKIGRQKVEDMFRVGEDITNQLSREPQAAKDFVEYLDYLHKSVDVCDKINDVLEYTKEVYNLMDEFNVFVDEEDINRLASILIHLDAVKTLVDNKLNAKPKLTKRFNTRLENDIGLMYERAEEIREEALQSWLIATNTQPAIAKATILGLQERMSELHSEAADFQSYQKAFKVELTQHEILEEIQNEVHLRQMLWESLDVWTNLLLQWYTCDFNTLDILEMDIKISEMLKNAIKLNDGLPENEMVPVFKEEVELYKERLPVVQYLRNENLKTRHWLLIEGVLGRKFEPDSILTLQILAEANCFDHVQEFAEISSNASSEASLEVLLSKVDNDWKERQLVVVPYKNSRDVFILAGVNELQILLEDSNININMIASSCHVVPIRSRVQDWISILDQFENTLDEWYACQQTWLQLEPIFSVPDIERQLPKEIRMFAVVNKSWKKIMHRTHMYPHALTAMVMEGIWQTLKRNNALLDQISRCLLAYLEVKRIIFPRFYFLSNNELLEILGHTKKPHSTQQYLRKCFDGIARLEFGQTQQVRNVKNNDVPILTNDIIAMLSPEGERIAFEKGLTARGGVEDWLRNVEKSMFLTLKSCMKNSLVDYEKIDRNEWLRLHPNQIVLTVSQIMWARNIQRILESSENRQRNLIDFELSSLTLLSALDAIARTEITSLQRKIICALITVDMHAKDIVANLITNKIDNVNDFEWLKTLRYYWLKSSETVEARMSEACIRYMYEYVGANGVLVQTPLTDRCYLCLTGALRMDLGGALIGPAGIGKTETVKNLAKLVAVQCIVFNCSESLDYKRMGHFLRGSVQSGAWCCFDDFNRIDIEVLSVIAQQLLSIRNAKTSGATRFMFEEREIMLVPSCTTFITMNLEHAGRTDLPDNLKSLFRPMAMMMPDYSLIAEVILCSEGFQSSRNLANKIVHMYKLFSEQLSMQYHYDFGMRSLKRMLITAGALKRADHDQAEEVILITAVCDCNLPKFLLEDVKLCRQFLDDLFPGIELPIREHCIMRQSAAESLKGNGLQAERSILTKTIQLHETMSMHCGVILMGQTGVGKTTIINNLADTLEKLRRSEQSQYCKAVHKIAINPKAVTISELYGAFDSATMKWKDGLLGLAIRNASTNRDEINQWIINDGPVDSVWIESLNTVLDDNKILCLANSERITLTPGVHLLFEITDLSQASPAMVSRCGVVFVAEDLGWLPYLKSWINKFSPESIQQDHIALVIELSTDYLTKMLDFVQNNCSQMIEQVKISKVAMLCSLLNTLLVKDGTVLPVSADTADKSKIKTFAIQCFIWSALWSVGGNLSSTSREELDIFTRELFASHSESKISEVNDLWCIYMDVGSKTLHDWNELIPEFAYNPLTPYYDISVPTLDGTRIGHIASMLLEARYPVMFVGDKGVGKTVVAKNVLSHLSENSNASPLFANFSAYTSSSRAQQTLEEHLERRARTVIGAPFGKYVTAFVDDVHMPIPEVYGAQPPIELLRQFLDYGGFYDRERMYWKKVQEIVVSCACSPSGGRRNFLTPRFVRHFAILGILPPDDITLNCIFQSIVKGFLVDFAVAIQDLSEPLVFAAVYIYRQVIEQLHPTPMKSHYIFNLRDLSKCIQGILQTNSISMREPTQMYRLFYHECIRVFHDRLINSDDKIRIQSIMEKACMQHFGNAVVRSDELLLFGDFMKSNCPKGDRLYEEILNYEKLEMVLQDFLVDYSGEVGNEMQIILFPDAIKHILRLVRILRIERGNGFVIGLSGLGKQSLTKLAAHINGCKFAQVELIRCYDRNSFHEDLRNLYYNVGITNEPTVFIFADDQIIKEEFLEDINNMLNTGEVHNLFEDDEYENIIMAYRAMNEASGINATPAAIFDLFISNVRKNLHLIICMNPTADTFRRRCRMFPSLVDCCTIDWFMKWPDEALQSIAQNTLAEVGDEELNVKIAETCVFMHKSIEDYSEKFYKETHRRYYYKTPRSYMKLIELNQKLFKKRSLFIENKREQLTTGLRKIKETNEVVHQMERELKILEPQLAEKSKILEELTVNLETEQNQSDEVRAIVIKEEALAKEKAAETTILAEDAQRDLEATLPALEAAQTALNALNKIDISELRAQKPPQLVQLVMEAVCVLLGEKSDWATAKQILSDPRFLDRLHNLDKKHIKEKTLIKLKEYVNHKDFIPDVIIKVSKVAKSLCIWVKAIEIYAKVYKSVEPKQRKVEAAEKELNETMTVLKEQQRQLTEIEAHIQGLQEQLDADRKAHKELEDNIELCAARLSRAGRLTSALAYEEMRWADSVETLAKEFTALPGDILLAAGFLAYLGVFNSKYRQELVNNWAKEIGILGIPSSPEFKLVSVLGEAYEIRIWNFHGLPHSVISCENAIIMTQAVRWPLIVDPQEQANGWIRNMEKDNNLCIVKLNDPNFQRIMESAIRTGIPTLIDEIEEFLDPILDTILNRQILVQDGRQLIHIGENIIDYDDSFKLYMTTNLWNPHFSPKICMQVTLINFNITPESLEEQLLIDISRIEMPELERQATELNIKINEDKNQLHVLENRVLTLLFTSEGCLLDDEALVDTLNESKENFIIISARLIETKAAAAKIKAEFVQYQILAARGSDLYFVIAQLAGIDCMYQFSLKYFKQIFNAVIEESPEYIEFEDKLKYLMKAENLTMYENVSRGLFEKDKLIFSFLLSVAVEKEFGKINELQWEFFLHGSTRTIINSDPKPNIQDLTDAMWLSVCHLQETFDYFHGLTYDITNNIDIELGDFKKTISIPGSSGGASRIKWSSRLSSFDKLLLFRALQQQDLIPAIGAFVRITLGKEFTENPSITLHNLFPDTNSLTPLVFVLSPGWNPLSSLQRFAHEKGFAGRLETISLGQDRGLHAQIMLERGRQDGNWVFLQNCHVAASWMPSLKNIVRDSSVTSHVDFRLFLSTRPSKSIPISILENSIKVTNDHPKDIRANVKRALDGMDQDYFEDCPFDQNWRAMVFGLVLFHAVIQGRTKFGPLGWNISYNFNENDRECALSNLHNFCMNASEPGIIPWDALEYITGWITYGGRITDAWDQRRLQTILKNFFSPETIMENCKYSQSAVYYCPEYETLAKFREFVNLFPYMDMPEIFGIHENANIIHKTKDSESFLLALVQGQSDLIQVITESSHLLVYSTAEEILGQIPKKIGQNEPFDLLIQRDLKGRISPLTTVLMQEIDRYNKLSTVLHESLQKLMKAIKGFLIISEDLENIYISILNNIVPQIWHSTGYPSLKSLASWVRDFQLRLDFLENWSNYGNPASFWISGFFFPQGFMTSVLQTYAREHDVPFDQLKFDFKVLPNIVEQQQIFRSNKSGMILSNGGVLIHGLFLDAARWDNTNMILEEQNPGEINPPMPIIHLIPTTTVQIGNRYEAPLYKNPNRAGVSSTTCHNTNFVTAVLLPSSKPQSFWIIQGTALLTQIID